MKNRILRTYLQALSHKKLGRLMVLTGARQTGKSTLLQHTFPDREFISLEDPALRPHYSSLSAADWIENHPQAVIDEIQKIPSLVETIKAVYDQNQETRYILSGGSQILLLHKIRESLAGRVVIQELFPLTLPEMATDSWEDPIQESRLIQWLKSPQKNPGILQGAPLTDPSYPKFKKIFEEYLYFGGMPALYGTALTDEDRHLWLKNYQQTYLQRDLSDLANLKNLEPFVLAQKALALRSGKLVNFSDLGRNAHVSSNTAKKFLRYLELSYQTLVLYPYSRNPEKRLAKSCKIHFLDPGIHRGILNRKGEVSGEEFESAVASEIWKQIKSFGLPFDFYHLRTADGREVDLLLECETGFVAIEIKMTDRVGPSDARAFVNLEKLLDKPLLFNLVLSRDPAPRKFTESVFALPAAWVLGASW